MLPDLTGVYKVTSDSVSLDRPAWMTQNPRVLIAPPAKRGSNLVVPRADGAVPLPRLRGAVVDTLRMVFVGDCDRAGAPAVDPKAQLLDNLAWFEANVYDHGTTAALSIEAPNGTWSGEWQLLSFDWGDADTAVGLTTCRASLRFEIPHRLVLTA